MADLKKSGKNPVRAKARLSPNGRIVIPATIRKELGVEPGDTILLEAEDGVLRIESVPTRVARIQRGFAHLVKPGGPFASDELIAERREEARREEEQFQRSPIEERLRNEGKIA
ncbi:MAG: AbrB/MazE/SpoVT family DNA-binding domain-containing protein [Terracidiphilus sp.]